MTRQRLAQFRRLLEINVELTVDAKISRGIDVANCTGTRDFESIEKKGEFFNAQISILQRGVQREAVTAAEGSVPFQ